MVLLHIHSDVSVYNFVRMRSDLAFLSYIIYALLFPDTVYLYLFVGMGVHCDNTVYFSHSLHEIL